MGARRWVASTDRPATLDLAARYTDVRRITRSRPVFEACVDAGWDADDLVAEVALRVHARQSMPSRYDPARGGVPKYLCLMADSILRNLLDQAQRRGRHEQVGGVDASGVACDAARTAVGVEGMAWCPDDAGEAPDTDCGDDGGTGPAWVAVAVTAVGPVVVRRRP